MICFFNLDCSSTCSSAGARDSVSAIGVGNSGSANVGNGCAALCGHDDDDDDDDDDVDDDGSTEFKLLLLFDDRLSPNKTNGSTTSDGDDGASMALVLCPPTPTVPVAVDIAISDF